MDKQLLFIFFILFTTLTIIFVIRHKEEKEPFLSLNEDHLQDIRNDKALQRCDVLMTNSPDLGKKGEYAMDTFIRGNRIKIWKPENENEKQNTKNSNIEYCYLYNDAMNETQDYMMNNNQNINPSACSLNNKLFQNPMIQNVFDTPIKDAAHNVPINKCVFEIDKSKANDSNIIQFWNTVSDIDCYQLSQDSRNELFNLNRDYNALQHNYNNLENRFQNTSNDIVRVKNNVAMCQLSNVEITKNYDDLNAIFNNTKDDVRQENELIPVLRRDLEALYKSISDLERETRKELKCVNTQKSRVNRCIENKDKCNEQLQLLNNQWKSIQDMSNELEKDNSALKGIIDKWEEEYRLKKELLDECNKRLKIVLENISRLQKEVSSLEDDVTKCQDTVNTHYKDIDSTQLKYDASSNNYYECINEKPLLEEKLNKCDTDLGLCINLGRDKDNELLEVKTTKDGTIQYKTNLFDDLINKIKKLEDSISINERLFLTCIDENADLRNKIETLKYRKDTLLKQLDGILLKNQSIQNETYKSTNERTNNLKIKFIENQMKRNEEHAKDLIENVCSLEGVDVKALYDKEVQKHKNLKEKLDKRKENDTKCPDECNNISVQQCLVHKNTIPEICDPPESESDNKTKTKMTFEIYDREGRKNQVIEFTEENRSAKFKDETGEGMGYLVYKIEHKKGNGEDGRDSKEFSDASYRFSGDINCGDENPIRAQNFGGDVYYAKVPIYLGAKCLEVKSSSSRVQTYPPKTNFTNGRSSGRIGGGECVIM